MTMSKRFGIVLLAGAIGFFGLTLGERLSVPGIRSFVSSAEAVVGRPLNAGECCWGRSAHGTAMRRWRILLLMCDYCRIRLQ